METVLVIIMAVTLIVSVGTLILAYVLWRDHRRADAAVDEALAEFADQSASAVGGPGAVPR